MQSNGNGTELQCLLITNGYIHQQNIIIPPEIISLICVYVYHSVTDDMNDKPNIKRIYIALTEGGLTGKYTEKTCGIDLSEAFFQFIIEEEFEDEQILDEFGDDDEEESFFKDWLIENKSIKESEASDIWRDINAAHKGRYDPNASINGAEIFKNYDISIRDSDLDSIHDLLKVQCPDLIPFSEVTQLDKATLVVIQIGKQNRNQPLLIYLFDAYNRYRIQRRKKIIQKLKKDGYNDMELRTIFDQKFRACSVDKFVMKKCTGIEAWLSESSVGAQKQFMEMCQVAITVLNRHILHSPPMRRRWTLVNDNILKVCEYILQSFIFIEEFSVQKHAPLPAQIEVVIIPKKFEEKEFNPVSIGDMSERLKNIKNKSAPVEIGSGTANRTLLQSANSVMKGNRYQRCVLVIDRRRATDKCYAFQPNSSNSFESNESRLLIEGLVQNLRNCVLPKCGNEKGDINVNTPQPFGLTFSFHCFSANEIRVYLCLNGWVTRFFIEDIKYFLPLFFVDGMDEKLESAFTKDQNRAFADLYKRVKPKCADPKFEEFYQRLFADVKHRCH